MDTRNSQADQPSSNQNNSDTQKEDEQPSFDELGRFFFILYKINILIMLIISYGTMVAMVVGGYKGYGLNILEFLVSGFDFIPLPFAFNGLKRKSQKKIQKAALLMKIALILKGAIQVVKVFGDKIGQIWESQDDTVSVFEGGFAKALICMAILLFSTMRINDALLKETRKQKTN